MKGPELSRHYCGLHSSHPHLQRTTTLPLAMKPGGLQVELVARIDHLERTSVSLPHTTTQPPAASRKVGWGRARLIVFRFVSQSSSTSFLLPWHLQGCTGMGQHLKHITIVSALHYFFHCTNHCLKLLFMNLLVSRLSLPASTRPSAPQRNLACSQLSSQHQHSAW